MDYYQLQKHYAGVVRKVSFSTPKGKPEYHVR